MKHISIFQRSIITKLMLVNVLILLSVGGIVTVNLLLSSQVGEMLITVIDKDMTQVIENAELNRDLNTVFADTHLLLKAFTERKDILKSEGTRLVTTLQTSIAATQEGTATHEGLAQFTQALQALLTQCEVIILASDHLQTMANELDIGMMTLDGMMTQFIRRRAGTEGEQSLSPLEPLQTAISGYYNKLLQMHIQLAESKQAYFEDAPVEEEAEAQILSLLEEVQAGLPTVIATDQKFELLGKQLIETSQRYKEQLPLFYQAMREFQTRLRDLDSIQTQMMTIMQTTDAEIGQATGRIRTEVLGNLRSSHKVTLILSGIVVGVLVLMGGYAVKQIRPLVDLAKTATRLATGDLTSTILAPRTHDEIGALANAFREMQAKIDAVVRDVKTSTSEVAQRSREMSSVADQMSAGAAEQASATEEVSASMEEMAATIRQTAENAKLTESMAIKSVEDAHAGKQAVTEIIQAMEVIAERVSMVQEIAGQTNILSLNATIEAAKAQEYGKGFAVVASSVRDLASQSRGAADEIRTLVHSCVTLSAQAGEVLQRLVPNSEKTAELVQEISAASQEQTTGIDHVNQAVQQLDSVTQQNAATVEEVAVTAESLSTQADTLQHTMAFFTVNELQSSASTKEADVLQLLQGIEKERLEALLTSALSDQAPDAKTAIADPSSQTLSESPALEQGEAIDLDTPNAAGDDRDQEFERY